MINAGAPAATAQDGGVGASSMTDIVQRLRNGIGMASAIPEAEALMDEAAARIERLLFEINWLRAGLRQIELNTRSGSPLILKINWLAQQTLNRTLTEDDAAEQMDNGRNTGGKR